MYADRWQKENDVHYNIMVLETVRYCSDVYLPISPKSGLP